MAANAQRTVTNVAKPSGGGRPPGPPDIDRRLTRLEEAWPRLEAKIDRVELRVSDLDGRLRSIEQTVTVNGAKLDAVDSRIIGLDTRITSLDARMRSVETGLANIGGKLDILSGQVLGKLPSWWQMPAVIGVTVAVLVALYAGVQYLRMHGFL